ncbi:MAG: hypothetical protein ACJ8F1_02115 [Polyangia bacterium]
MKHARWSFVLALSIWAAGVARADPALNAAELAQGPYAMMHMRLQKTFLKINVADVEVRVDRPTQSRFAQVAAGQGYSPALESQLAPIAIGAARALVQMQFVRDVPLNRWMGVVRDNLEDAREAGLITRDVERRVSDALPVWFAGLKDRGYLKGDRVTYSVTPDALHTVVAAASGQVLLDMTERGDEARRVVLASYFAPKSDTREPLLRSLLPSK